MQNHFVQTPILRPTRIQVLDATRTPQDYQNDMLMLRQRFGETAFNAMADTANQNARTFEKQQKEAERATSQAPEPNHILMYSRALASLDPLALQEFIQNQPTETLVNILAELTRAPKHYNSVFNYQITYAIEKLQFYLAQRVQKNALLEIFAQRARQLINGQKRAIP